MLAPPSSHRIAGCERHSGIKLMAGVAEVPRTRKRDRIRKALGLLPRPNDVALDHPGMTQPTSSAVISWYDSGFRLSQPANEFTSTAPPQHAAIETAVASSHGSGAEQATSEDCSSAALIQSVYGKYEGELQEEERAWLTPEIASVYVVRRTAPADQLKMISDTLEWRIRRRKILATRECAACAQNPRSHDARIFGVDGDGDVVIMNCFALSQEYTPRGVTDHLACLFERAIDEFGKPSTADAPSSPGSADARLRWTWVIDVRGFGLRHTDPRVSIEIITLLECAYPDRLKKLLIVDAPSIFFTLWRAVQRLISERSKAKIEFVSWDAAAGRYETLFGSAMASRLLAEGRENRGEAAAVKEKHWTTFYGTQHS